MRAKDTVIAALRDKIDKLERNFKAQGFYCQFEGFLNNKQANEHGEELAKVHTVTFNEERQYRPNSSSFNVKV